MSLLTSTRSGQPARTLIVGCRLRSREVICEPTCSAELATPVPALFKTRLPEDRAEASWAESLPAEVVASPETVECSGIDVIDLNDAGKIQHLRAFWDPGALMAQM